MAFIRPVNSRYARAKSIEISGHVNDDVDDYDDSDSNRIMFDTNVAHTTKPIQTSYRLDGIRCSST